MSPSPTIDTQEFQLMREFIEKHCGIHVTDEKKYLIETRLTTLMAENSCTTFGQLYSRASTEASHVLRDKIIDAMTTNETLWFRDTAPYAILGDTLLPMLAAEVRAGRKQKIRIWSAACSTGQEPYSIAITILEKARSIPGLSADSVEIIASDISSTVLFMAKLARYDGIAMSRGMPQDIRDRYFDPAGRVWALRENVKRMVTFKKMNLQESFAGFGTLDLVFCRNVLIYFADAFKRDIMHKIATTLKPAGHLFLGASESIINYSTEYKLLKHEKGLYYQVKQ
jgi:chemotaxis protein methyltransferase CheR